MGPSLSISADRAAQFRQNREDPISMELMTQAVTLMPCAHTFDEPSIHRIPGFGGLETPEPCEQNSGRVTKVRIVNRINCPICRAPAREYYRNWAMRDVCQEIPALYGEEKKDVPPRIAVPAPRGTLQEKFEIIVGGFIACCLSSAALAFAMVKESENAELAGKIKKQNETIEMLKGTIVLGIFIIVICSCAFSKK